MSEEPVQKNVANSSILEEEVHVEGKAIKQSEAIARSELKDDHITPVRTIYDVSVFELMWRNFLAGMSRTFGSIILYLLLMFFVTVVISRYIVPKIMPIVNSFEEALQSVNKLNDIPGQFQLPNLPQLQNPGGNNTSGSDLQTQLQEQLDALR